MEIALHSRCASTGIPAHSLAQGLGRTVLHLHPQGLGTASTEPLRIKHFIVTINYIFTMKNLQIHPKVSIKINTSEPCQSVHLCTNTYKKR